MANEPGLGSIAEPFCLHLLWIPQVLTEWAALIPLILHLASPDYDYRLADMLCLKSRCWQGD